MAAIDDLLKRVDDPALREALTREYLSLRDDQKFGLVFERHLPESVRLPGHPVRKGLFVEERATTDSPRWTVRKVVHGVATVSRTVDEKLVVDELPVGDLIVVREFDKPIYPGLKSVGSIERGEDKPFHTVIAGENFHALEALLYTSEGQVDVIYIDPPYNTGNAEWMYNDRYVDSEDRYNHSKWLAFMERRLLHARTLLKDSGVIFISIDAHEHARLEMLCDQVFGEANELTSFVWEKTAHFGRQKQNFYANCEYVLAYAKQLKTDSGTNREVLVESVKTEFEDAPLYNASNPVNTLVFPPGSVAFRIPDGTYHQSTDAKYEVLTDVTVVDGVNVNDLILRFKSRWSQSTVNSEIAKGTTFLVKSQKFAIRAEYADGKISFESPRQTIYTNPNNPSRSVSRFGEKVGTTDEGSADLKAILGCEPSFSYPKPTSLIEYLLSLFANITGSGEVHPKDLLVLDYFVGTGTTTEAVMRLNALDGGRRRSIAITNNELAVSAARELTQRGFMPGDPEWEAAGIFESVTKSRLSTVATGIRPDGTQYSDGLSENVEFFELTYEDRDRVSLGAAFEAIAPLLWMKAGAVGPRINKREGAWALPDGARYGLLFDASGWREFVDAINASEIVTHAFIVTDSNSVFQQVVRELPPSVEPVRLYENYLDSFQINTGGVA